MKSKKCNHEVIFSLNCNLTAPLIIVPSKDVPPHRTPHTTRSMSLTSSMPPTSLTNLLASLLPILVLAVPLSPPPACHRRWGLALRAGHCHPGGVGCRGTDGKGRNVLGLLLGADEYKRLKSIFVHSRLLKFSMGCKKQN